MCSCAYAILSEKSINRCTAVAWRNPSRRLQPCAVRTSPTHRAPMTRSPSATHSLCISVTTHNLSPSRPLRHLRPLASLQDTLRTAPTAFHKTSNTRGSLGDGSNRASRRSGFRHTRNTRTVACLARSNRLFSLGRRSDDVLLLIGCGSAFDRSSCIVHCSLSSPYNSRAGFLGPSTAACRFGRRGDGGAFD